MGIASYTSGAEVKPLTSADIVEMILLTYGPALAAREAGKCDPADGQLAVSATVPFLEP